MYSLSPPLVQALQRIALSYSRSDLERAVSSIHEKYTSGGDQKLVGSNEALAYALYRMPSTFAAVQYVLSKMQELRPDFQPKSLLDVGCGPGTAYFAMKESYPSLVEATAIDHNQEFLELFRTLAQAVSVPLPELLLQVPERKWDVGVCSYMLGEMEQDSQVSLLERVTKSCDTLIILEPGTVRGFHTILRLREWAISHAMPILAPCPHMSACPMQHEKSWCHVRVRLTRPSFQQTLKHGTLGYEDEPLCYLIIAPTLARYNRLVDSPQKRKGHVHLNLCQPEGQIKKVVVSKKNKDLYTRAKELEWGDVWDSSGLPS